MSENNNSINNNEMPENTFTDTNLNNLDKPKSKKWVLPLVAGLILVLAGFGFAYAKGWIGASKQSKVVSGLISIVNPLEDKNTVEEDYFGSEALIKDIVNTMSTKGNFEIVNAPFTQKMQGSYSQIEPLLTGSGIAFDFNRDSKSKSASGNFGITYKGSSLIGLDYFSNTDRIQIAVPALYKDLFEADLTGDLNAKVKNMPLLSGAPESTVNEIVSALSNYKKSIGEKTEVNKLGILKYTDLVSVVNDFMKSWDVQDAAKKTMMYNGKETSFDGYDVNITKDQIIKFLTDFKAAALKNEEFKKNVLDQIISRTAQGKTKEEAYEAFNKDFDEFIQSLKDNENFTGFKFTMHLNNKKQAVAFHTEIKDNNGKLYDINLERNGGDFLNQNAVLTMTDKESKMLYKVTSTGSTNNKVQVRNIKFNVSQDTASSDIIIYDSSLDTNNGNFNMNLNVPVMKVSPFNLSINGKYTDVKKGKGFTTVFDNISIKSGSNDVITLKGSVSVSTEGVKATELSGNKVDVFTLDKTQAASIITEVQKNIQGLVKKVISQ